MDDLLTTSAAAGTLSPAYKLRRRTSSDATWKNRRRLVLDVNDDVTAGRDDNNSRRTGIYRLNENVNQNELIASNYHQQLVDRDNGNLPRSSVFPSRSCSSYLTLCPGSRAVPSEWLLQEVKLSPVGDQVTDLEKTIRSTIDAHLNTNNYSTEVLKRGFKLYDAINQTSGGRDFSEVLKSMGPPNPDKMLSFFMDNMVPTIKRVVAFANLLPGFVDLNRDDRAMLFKQGSFEIIVTRYTRLFTTDGMFTPDMTVKIPRHAIHMMPLGDLFSEQYQFADAFNSLELTDAETGLVCALMLVNPDRNGLRDRAAVIRLRHRYLQCIYVYLKKQHPDVYDDLFSRIVDILPLSAAVNESHAKKMNELKTTASSHSGGGSCNLPFPDLHNDVFQ